MGHTHVVKELLNHGADVNARDFEGKTPLAVVHESDERMRRLLTSHGGVTWSPQIRPETHGCGRCNR
jgi:ankyrin repeat protein